MIMKKSLLLFGVFMFSSCSILFPNLFQRKSANFSFKNLWFNTQLDYNKSSSYLFNTTQLNYNAT
jgi:hypothetical protein